MAVTRIKNNQITDATINAGTKLVDFSVSAAKLANSLTYGSDLTISGNLTVSGSTTTVDTATVVIEDPTLLLASDTTGTPTKDVGFVGERGNSTNIAFVWDESATEFITAFTSSTSDSPITVSAYANLKTLNTAVTGTLAVTGTSAFTGNVTGNLSVTANIAGGNLLTAGLATVGTTLVVTGNTTGGNLITAGLVSATGNVTGGNLNTGAQVVATGNVTGGNVITGGLASVTGNITGGNVITGGLVDATGNVTGGNLNTGAQVVATGNVTGGNLNTGAQVVATGNVTGGNLVTAGLASVTGNVTGGNLITGGLVSATGTITATGNVTGGNLNTGAQVVATGNVTGGNLNTGAQVVATGNITGGNLITAGLASVTGTITATANITGGNLITAGLVSATGTITATANITGGNLITAGLVSVTGNITGGNLITGGLASVTGNITGGNLTTTGLTQTGTLNTTGNATVGGNLIVQGNITYINIDDLRVEDPIIILGTGPNGAPLTADDNKDRGVFMEYFTTEVINAFMGYDNSADKMIMASNASIANDVVTVNSFGTLQAGDLEIATATATANITGGNLITGAQVVATGNVTGGNLVTAGLASVTGNITGGNVTTAGTGTIGNIVISGSNVTSTAGRITVNQAAGDIDFAINGGTANIFYFDAGANSISMGNATQVTNSILSLNTTTSFIVPRGNTAQRPATGVTGMLRYNSTNDGLEIYDADGWITVGSTVFTVIDSETFNGDGSTVAFTLATSQTTDSCIVSINGVVQLPTTAYAVSSTTLTFTEAPADNDVIEVRELTTTTTVTNIANGTSEVTIPVADGNVNIVVAGTTRFVAKTTGANIAGTLDVTGNVTGGNLITAGLVSATGNITGGNLNTGAQVIASGNITGNFFNGNGSLLTGIDATSIQSGNSNVRVITSAGNIAVNVNGAGIITFASSGILNNMGNATGNIGNSTVSFNTIFAKATTSQYADLAEMYSSDANYESGTVVTFGGTNEVTISTTDSDSRVAGIISTNPAHLMNSRQVGTHPVAVALTGRVPCKVSGTVRKGDMMVSAGDGHARAATEPKIGTVIGKAIEDFDGTKGVIEVVVGRV